MQGLLKNVCTGVKVASPVGTGIGSSRSLVCGIVANGPKSLLIREAWELMKSAISSLRPITPGHKRLRSITGCCQCWHATSSTAPEPQGPSLPMEPAHSGFLVAGGHLLHARQGCGQLCGQLGSCLPNPLSLPGPHYQPPWGLFASVGFPSYRRTLDEVQVRWSWLTDTLFRREIFWYCRDKHRL